jgi:hypothetical protein
MDVHTPPQMHGDLGQAAVGVGELDQTLHIDPILNQVAQAAEAEMRQRDEMQRRAVEEEQEGLRDLEMQTGDHEQVAQQGSPRVSEFNMHAIDELPHQENGMHSAEEEGQQEMRMDDAGEGRTFSRSPGQGQGDTGVTGSGGASSSARSATIKQLIVRLVKGVEDVINESASAESKVGEKVVWSLYVSPRIGDVDH